MLTLFRVVPARVLVNKNLLGLPSNKQSAELSIEKQQVERLRQPFGRREKSQVEKLSHGAAVRAPTRQVPPRTGNPAHVPSARGEAWPACPRYIGANVL